VRRAFTVELKGGDVLVEWWDAPSDEEYRNGTFQWVEGRYCVRVTLPIGRSQHYVYECWVRADEAEGTSLYIPGQPSIWNELVAAAAQRWREHSHEHGLADGRWHGPADREPR